jgi:nickel superoxide dismutase
MLATLVLLCFSPGAFSHCQLPCGIYDDAMRFKMMAENITTIEKSMNEINTLSTEKNINYNQVVRWVINKENHSDYLSETVSEYFMKQRITPAENNQGQAYQDYINKLTLLHKIMIYSMKCKQTTDLNNVAKLKEYLEQFRKAYMGAETAAH